MEILRGGSCLVTQELFPFNHTKYNETAWYKIMFYTRGVRYTINNDSNQKQDVTD